MKQFSVIVCAIFLLSVSCKKGGKGCWRGYDGLLVETGVFCDKTKEEALGMPYTAFVCPAHEKKYCWVLSNNVHYPCIPQSIIEDFCRLQGLTFTKESCTVTCRYERLDNNGSNMVMLQIHEGLFLRMLKLSKFLVNTDKYDNLL